MKWMLIPTLAAVVFGLFQNCGKGEQTIPGQQSSIVESVSTNALVQLDPAQQNVAFRVSLQGNQIYSGTEYYWSSAYAGGGTPCSATICGDGTIAALTCPQTGNVTIHLVATDTAGQMTQYELPLNVDTPPSATPAPVDCATPAPSPTPTPAPTRGQALYTNNCVSCHGPLSASTKHGITRSQLDTGIATIPQMAGFSGLSSADRDAIVEALQ